MRSLARWTYRRLFDATMTEMTAEDLRRPAVVFAPHEDDEVLGCGGLMARKRKAGARITIAFLTDGSQSHAHLMPPEQLSALRKGESVAAAETLGVPNEQVIFLGFPDGHLSEHEAAGVERVADLLRREAPGEVYYPYFRDPPPDHQATTRIVRSALSASNCSATAYEYPIWYWHHWPWIPLDGGLRGKWRNLRAGLALNRDMMRECRSFVRIREVLDVKRAALECHRSQMQRLVPDPKWVTLGDTHNGDWLACFFQDREIFYRYSAPANPQ
jgi:LmbE family N-acetylglucosaminyl deacetylase